METQHNTIPDLSSSSKAIFDAALGGKPIVAPSTSANPEMGSRPRRRSFSAKEKLRILEDVDAAAASGIAGAIGAILRREGIYSSTLTNWRRQREAGNLSAKRGPKLPLQTDLQAEITRLHQENTRLQTRLTYAEQIIDLQKKVSDLLAIPLAQPAHNSLRL